MRNVIIHAHLFKNAGTTLDWALKRSFGPRFFEHHDQKSIRLNPNHLGEFLEEQPKLAVISSHHVQFPLPELPDITFFPLIMLRHPVDRVGSVYNFEHRQRVDTPGAIAAKKYDFNDYVEWRMQPDVNATIRNFQTRCILGSVKHARRPLTDEEFEKALQATRKVAAIGIVDLYDESMVFFEEWLTPHFPKLDLAYVHQNVSSGRKKTLADRANEVLDSLSPRVRDLLLANNKYDIKIYEAARNAMLTRIETDATIPQKIKVFQKRCSALSWF